MEYGLFIGGQWVDSTSQARISVENPATQQLIGTVSRGTKEDVDRAVAAARKAFPHWANTPVEKRSQILREVGQILERRKKDFAAVITKELGMPAKHVEHWQIKSSIKEAGYFADMAETYSYETQQRGGLVRREPIGVVGALTPWN